MVLELVLIYVFRRGRRVRFDEAVYAKVKEVPRGRVTTYKEIAMAIGRGKAYRAIGNALNKNPHPITVPCHRVVKSDLGIGGFSKGTKAKKKLLKEEGVKFDGDKVMREFLFRFCRS
jgi:methylated-DNA-[protein]-cysteine S-methyltransferase